VHFIGINIEFSIFEIVFKVRIVKLSAQRDMKTLVKYLLSLPGLDSGRISAGLKVPPLHVLSTDYEHEATQMRDTLEKYGAVCDIENTDAAQQHRHESEQILVPTYKRSIIGNKLFLILIIAVILFISIISYFFSYSKYDIRIAQFQIEADNFLANPASWIGTTVNDPSGLLNRIVVEDSSVQKSKDQALSSQINKELRKALVKNPYNDSAWKALYEKLEKEGDSVGAKSARESHARAVKAQQVLLNLARGLGKDVHVEIRDNAVYYTINKQLTDSEFYEEAVKLKRSLNSRFPGKDLVLENHASNQRVTMKAE